MFFVEEERLSIRVAVVLDPSIFIRNELEDGNVRFSMKRKGQYRRIAFCVNLAQLSAFHISQHREKCSLLRIPML